MDGAMCIMSHLTVAALYTEGKSYFVEVVDTGGNPKTAEYLIDLSKQIISTANDKYDCKVKSVITDNTNSMVQMLREFDKQKN